MLKIHAFAMEEFDKVEIDWFWLPIVIKLLAW